jgi:4-amino-4-deoxy-L-arabinose transferase-like glycosyltransferase
VYTAIVGLVIVRFIAIGVTPLGLDVEEAQYWQWSTMPDLGYFTKPPMIAWLIGLGTAIFGETDFGVRALAPVMQAISTVLVMRIAATTYSPQAGWIAAILWMTIPASALGGFIMSTDSPMITFMLAGLAILAPWARAQKISIPATGLAGLFAGLAMMSKYAAIYLPLGLILWWIWEGRRHHLITWRHAAVFLLGAVVSLMPNIVWNLKNGFVTARHLSHNANLDEPQYSLFGSLEFIFSQLGIVGPVVFVMAVVIMIFKRQDPHARFWIALFIPAITIITIQAFFSDANANWAVASWPAALVLTAGYCAEHWRRLRLPYLVGIGVNASFAVVFIFSTIAGSFGPLTPPSDPLRKLKAWDLHAQDIQAFSQTHGATQIVVARRGHAAHLKWELRNSDLKVVLIDNNGIAENHFEQRFAWSPEKGQVSVFVNGEVTPPDFKDVLTGPARTPKVAWEGISKPSAYDISTKRQRILIMHLGVEE